ncbi:MAG: iron ABC transporter permease [Oscillospiraceae bacterium]|nr:iron ABC transporter permease [Oscillospiraceae bacterium]
MMKTDGFSQAKKSRCVLTLLIMALAVVFAFIMSIGTGSVSIAPLDIFRIIFSGAAQNSAEYGVIMNIRMPRLLAAGLLGGALSVSGYLLQSFFRNPIAGPFVLGISSGARLAVGFTLIVMLNRFSRVHTSVMLTAAFVGAMLSMAFVLLCSKRVSGMPMLLVIGIMTGYICSAITDFLIVFAKESHIVDLAAWSMGSFSGVKWRELSAASIVVFAALAAALALCKPIDAYQMGEGYAKSLGVNVKLFRTSLIIISGVLSGTAAALAGIVSFVGVAVPHIARLTLGTAKPIYAIPACFLCGCAFCMFCDLIARTLFAPSEIAVGAVTAVFGAPIVIWLLVKRHRGGTA